MDFLGAYSAGNLIYLLQGLLNTLFIAVISIIFSFIIGGLLATVRYAKIFILSKVTAVVVEAIRNLPLLLIIFFTHFALPEVGIKLGIVPSTIVGLTIFEAAMLSEIIRSGLNSIEKGQIEAGRSSGLTWIQTMRYIILPQALRRMVPPIVSQFISLLKDTSLAIVIAMPELMHNAQIVNAKHVSYVIPIYILLACLYFIVNFSLSLVARRLEKREKKSSKTTGKTLQTKKQTAM
ncbi:amino acid ABC transporter permease [Metabacillus sp. RGM 3146]|uniref:amino acid ABC transporter permease n=1 Tax=Metabacillus sp. RGM 3146 TaxID=3401092 RepID=UPI003B99D1BD